jgi:hypothetical protein
MAKTGYSAHVGAAVALTAATAKTVVGVLGPASFGIDLTGFEVDFDGVTASALPVLCEVCYNTWATNPPGTNSTSITPVQEYGRVVAHGTTAAKTWTAGNEPTVLTVLRAFQLDPNKGLFAYDYPLGQTPDSDVADGFSLRFTAPAGVNVFAGLRWERS